MRWETFNSSEFWFPHVVITVKRKSVSCFSWPNGRKRQSFIPIIGISWKFSPTDLLCTYVHIAQCSLFIKSYTGNRGHFLLSELWPYKSANHAAFAQMKTNNQSTQMAFLNHVCPCVCWYMTDSYILFSYLIPKFNQIAEKQNKWRKLGYAQTQTQTHGMESEKTLSLRHYVHITWHLCMWI